mgnify:CR=1 FL=1
MVREVSARPREAREFLIRRADRILFGADNLTQPDRTADLYASRYWALRTLWETDYDGESPIEDPDVPAGAAPRLRGISLPREILVRIYRGTAESLGLAGSGAAEDPR